MYPLYVALVCIGFAIIGYCLGSILFASIVAKKLGKNVRQIGSTNPGATNVAMHIGKRAGVFVMMCDALKGYITVIICLTIYRYSIYLWYNPQDNIDNVNYYSLVYIGGFFAMLGHCFPITYMIALCKNKFKFAKAKYAIGGKGVATTGGILFTVSPWLGLTSMAIFFVIVLMFRYASIGSMFCMTLPAGLVFIPIKYLVLYLFDNQWFGSYVDVDHFIWLQLWIFIFLIVNGLIVLARHRSNIIRMMNHEERRMF